MSEPLICNSTDDLRTAQWLFQSAKQYDYYYNFDTKKITSAKVPRSSTVANYLYPDLSLLDFRYSVYTPCTCSSDFMSSSSALYDWNNLLVHDTVSLTDDQRKAIQKKQNDATVELEDVNDGVWKPFLAA